MTVRTQTGYLQEISDASTEDLRWAMRSTLLSPPQQNAINRELEKREQMEPPKRFEAWTPNNR